MAEVHAIGQPGQRLLVTIVDELATRNPTYKLGAIPKGPEVSDGYEDITASELARAVNAMAWWMDIHVGRGRDYPTIAYMGSNDIRYLVMILASNKTGYKPLLPSTRLSDEAYQHLLSATDCRTFFYSSEKQRRVAEIKAFQEHTQFLQVPSIADLFNRSRDVPLYPFSQSFAEAEDNVAIIIHSSGTTGMPKPVHLTHGFLSTMDYAAYLPLPTGRESTMFDDCAPDKPVLSTTPFFHLMGIISFTESLFHGVPFIMCPEKPLSVELLINVITTTRPFAAMLPPSILEEMSYSEPAKQALSVLERVYFAGAPLAPEAGDTLSAVAQLITVIGTSEMGIISSMVPHGDRNWGYFEWTPSYGLEMRPVGESEQPLYELVLPRDACSRRKHGVFHTFPERMEYHSNDLFTQHPQNPHLWRYDGRLDDVIVLSNGEKLNPVTLEKIVEGHPAVHRALLTGQSRFETALLVEPVWEHFDGDVSALIESLWPLVQTANTTVPNYGRVSKDKIRLAARDKPFALTPKGTTKRNAVNKLYASEIDAIYAAAEDAIPESQLSLDQTSLAAFLRDIVRSLMGADVGVNDDLFASGLDSLQTMQLTNTLRRAVRARMQAVDITSQLVYSNPTVSRLAAALLKLIHGESLESVPRAERIHNMVAKYTNDLQPATKPHHPAPASSTVILTGSTGSLGTYLLSTLLSDPSVSKIYCFNRSSDAATRQKQSFLDKGLETTLLSSKAEFLTVSFGALHFGLDDAIYNHLLQTANLIIHNAWKVNFNHPLESFEDPHLKGLHEFVSFSLNSRYGAHLSFVSSVSTIGAWSAAMGPAVPEKALGCDAVLQQGYGESKHVGERICEIAAHVAGVPTTVFRVGQVAGPTTEKGVWNRDEWVPALVKTSKELGKVPSELGGYEVDWIPVDTLATIISELLHTRTRTSTLCKESNTAFFHLVNPVKTTWAALVPTMERKYGVTRVSLENWIAELDATQALNPSEEEVRAKPALKLLDFYLGLSEGEAMAAPIEVRKTQAASRTMAGLGAVKQEDLENWMSQWGF